MSKVLSLLTMLGAERMSAATVLSRFSNEEGRQQLWMEMRDLSRKLLKAKLVMPKGNLKTLIDWADGSLPQGFDYKAVLVGVLSILANPRCPGVDIKDPLGGPEVYIGNELLVADFVAAFAGLDEFIRVQDRFVRRMVWSRKLHVATAAQARATDRPRPVLVLELVQYQESQGSLRHMGNHVCRQIWEGLREAIESDYAIRMLLQEVRVNAIV